MKSKNLLIPMLVALLATALMVACVFLPFAREITERSDPLSASLMEMSEVVGSFNLILTYLILGFALLAALFAVLKLPVVTIVLDVLSFGAFILQKTDFKMREVVPSECLEYGAAHSLFLIAAVILLAGAVWMIIAKAKAKKATAQA